MQIHIMCKASLWAFLIFVISPINGNSIASTTSDPVERANLADAIRMVMTSNENEQNSSEIVTKDISLTTPTTISTTEQKTVKSEEKTTEAVTVQVPKEVSNSGEQRIPVALVIQQQQLPTNENLFSGLAQNVGQLNIGGIIMEAFKLAQNSIALFGQSLAGQLQGSPFVITNTTKLVGV